MTELLEVEGLCAGYGAAPVLHDVDLRLAPGTITAVLGANGAGKTTLLRTLSGLLRPSAGRIDLTGRDLIGLPVERRVMLGVAHVPEGRGVIGELTVQENLRLGGLWRKGAGARRETDAAIAEVYDLFEPLARRRGYHGHQLSGGERQMLALGRALVARPKFLLLDEPSLGLAPVVAASIMALLRTLRDASGMAVLLVEQNVHSALAIADEGVVVSLGRVVARGKAADLQADEGLRHAYLGF
ncbi:MAG: branched-chain amino acid transport system ATP-binding protein [Pseudonocardiales bacterium]|nr:putative transporter ATP-binding protein [Pseudonocardiales bacterium]MDT4970508.1 branched-chain amino acid transport system ATP-binding protein [Pseudonocardiales bacterium]